MSRHKDLSSDLIKQNYFRRFALPSGIAIAGLGITTIGIILMVKALKKIVADDDAEVENYEIVKNKPFFI
jgi:hypothetical protein